MKIIYGDKSDISQSAYDYLASLDNYDSGNSEFAGENPLKDGILDEMEIRQAGGLGKLETSLLNNFGVRLFLSCETNYPVTERDEDGCDINPPNPVFVPSDTD